MRPVKAADIPKRRRRSATWLFVIVGLMTLWAVLEHVRAIFRFLSTWANFSAGLHTAITGVITLSIPLVFAILLWMQKPIEKYDSIVWIVGGIITIGLLILEITAAVIDSPTFLPWFPFQPILVMLLAGIYTALIGSALTSVRFYISPQGKEE